MRSKILLILRAAVSIVLIAVLIYVMRDSIPKMLGALKGLPVSIFLLGFMLFLVAIFIASFRLKILLAAQNIPLNILSIVKLTFMGYFFSSFLPTSVGGDVVKAFYISKASNKTIQSYTSVFIDRFLGMFTIFLIATGALFYTRNIPQFHFKWLLPVLLIGSILFLVFLFNRRTAKILSFLLAPLMSAKLKEKFKDVYNAMHNYKNHKSAIIKCLLISTVGQVIAFSATCVFGVGLNSLIPLKLVLLVMPIASIVSMLPSIYGMGPREMAIVVILSPFIGKEKALAIAFLWLAVLLLTALIGGIIYGFMGVNKIRLDDLSA